MEKNGVQLMSGHPSFFNGGHLSHLTQLTKEASSAREFLGVVEKVLKFLRNSNFRSARYYECATSRPDNDDILILAAQSTGRQTVEIGYPIKYKTSTLGLASDHHSPAIGSCKDTNQKWVGDLGI